MVKNMINMKTKYITKTGFDVILYEIIEEQSQAMGKIYMTTNNIWIVATWNIKNGKSILNEIYDLIEKPKYNHIKLDNQVVVWNNNDHEKYFMHFAGINEKTGKAFTFINGQTSWSATSVEVNSPLDLLIEWDNCLTREEYTK